MSKYSDPIAVFIHGNSVKHAQREHDSRVTGRRSIVYENINLLGLFKKKLKGLMQIIPTKYKENSDLDGYYIKF